MVHRFFDLACRTLAALGLGALLVLASLTMLDGALRSLAGHPIDIVREIGDLVAAVAVACCLPVALYRRSNIALRTLSHTRLTVATRALDILADTGVLVVLCGMAWQFFALAEKTRRAGDATWMMNLPKAPFWFTVAAVIAFACLVQASVLARTLRGDKIASVLEGAP